MKEWAKSWKSSKKPKKQRKYRYNAPLHIKQKFVHSHLSKELRKKYEKRSIGLRKGDKVKIARGEFKKQEGKVSMIDLKHSKVYVEGIEGVKKDGTKVRIAIEPSKLVVTELNLEDRLRQKILTK